MKSLCVMGSTGSIGTQTLQIVDQFPEHFEVLALTAGKNLDLLKQQVARYEPRYVVVSEASDAEMIQIWYPGLKVLCGREGLEAVAALEQADLIVMGILGFAALAPTLAAVRAGKDVALANKESIITAGSLLQSEIARSKGHCIPVDSEHNALYQLLQGRERKEIRSLILTASGGPLLSQPDLPLEAVTPELAVKHPRWSMGPKISVDSATLMNKGLELIEAHILFNFPAKDIEVWIHPQSLVHGALCFRDNSYIAQFNKPDMRCSIGYAMAYPERLDEVIPSLSFKDMSFWSRTKGGSRHSDWPAKLSLVAQATWWLSTH
ncbi:MAG: 1-deoxy-D-xylulose-5-phosphate reductoisomerase [Bdellovibrionales bacterium]|nr:1-deoxy-D-xylulose-5-phosphate reductoisomerase [Bdellovibrionales bacterium]